MLMDREFKIGQGPWYLNVMKNVLTDMNTEMWLMESQILSCQEETQY